MKIDGIEVKTTGFRAKLILVSLRVTMFLQLHAPILLPVVDRILHLFGICSGIH